MKNEKIKTTQILNALTTKRRIILSGTPIQNDLEEFYAMVSFVNPGVLGEPDAFRRIYVEPIALGRGIATYCRLHACCACLCVRAKYVCACINVFA